MVDNGVENNSGPKNDEERIAKQVESATADSMKQEMGKLEDSVKEIKTAIALSLDAHKNQHYFEGSKEDKDSPKGKVTSLKEFIQKMLFASEKAPDKLPSAENSVQTDPKAPVPTPKSTQLIKKISESIKIDQVTDQNAAYFFDILKSITDGKVTTVDDYLRELKRAEPLRYISPGMFEKLQKFGVQYAVENDIPEKDAKQKFGVIETDADGNYSEANQRRAVEERSASTNFSDTWQHLFSGHFNEGQEKDLIESLYSPTKFVRYYEKVQEEVKTKHGNFDKKQTAQEASKEMEVHIALLFGKLYQKLDHESPKEFFQSIEQEDIMKGITPVKTELKRRINLLATSLRRYQEEMKAEKKEVPLFFQRLEQDTETVGISVGGKIKPRPRFKTTLIPHETSGSDFAHYLDQVVEHYIDARRYTHNSRAVLLHPVDAQKGFYGQLAQFANETTSLDFDQMMLLPDNDIFQSAFGLYNKMIEEGFAKYDWRHSAGMFTPQINKHMTQIEGRVLEQLKTMYGDISDERLTAALTMAVGASRGMFLTEIEMAAHADPHLSEKGGSTFVSYYHQDATALMAFNPQHLLYRFYGGPNLLDPIFFLPIDGLKGTQAFNDHHALWDKAEKYKASFLKGRKELPEQTFFDKLDNIGLVGGPMQRKGWRTQWQLDSLYISDQTESIDSQGRVIKGPVKTNHLKTFKHLENIGYELLQDYVTKLTAGSKPDDDDLMEEGSAFLTARDTFGASNETKRVVQERRKLFEYIFEKYFHEDPKNLTQYLDEIRKTKREEVIKAVRGGKSVKNIDEAAEAATSGEFFDRMLARVITQRLPSKILRMDRDRLSKDGTSRYRQVMKDMGLDGQFDHFDNIMQDMILAEQMLRKDVSTKMRDLQLNMKPGEEWKFGEISYEMTPETIKKLFQPLIANGKMDQPRLDNVLALYGHIKSRYLDDKTFINSELVPYFKQGGAQGRKSKYTIALDETDLSFIPFRGGGESVLVRSLRDIAGVEKNVTGPITEFVSKLRDMAINGKKDFGPIIEIISKVWGGMDGIIGFPYANELASNIASMTIMYMKKDTQARALMGLGGAGRFNSMAAEAAHKKVGVWEWDSTDIDRFISALEVRGLVPGTPYNSASEPSKEPIYINMPFVKEPIKIPFFQRRRHDHHVWSKTLRDNFGGTKMDMFFDIMNKYLPFIALFILWSIIKKAFEDSEGKKK